MIKLARANLEALKGNRYDPEEESKKKLQELYARFHRPDEEFFEKYRRSIAPPPWERVNASYGNFNHVLQQNTGHTGAAHVNVSNDNYSENQENPINALEGIDFTSEPDFDYEEPVQFGDDMDTSADLQTMDHLNYNDNFDFGDHFGDDHHDGIAINGSSMTSFPHDDDFDADWTTPCLHNQERMTVEPMASVVTTQPLTSIDNNNQEEIKRLKEEKGELSNLICDLMDEAEEDEEAGRRLAELRARRKIVESRLKELSSECLGNSQSSSSLSSSLPTKAPVTAPYCAKTNVPLPSPMSVVHKEEEDSQPDFTIIEEETPKTIARVQNIQEKPKYTVLEETPKPKAPIDRVIPVTPLRALNILSQTDNPDSEYAGFKFAWSGKVQEALKSVFKLPSFRKNQLEAINAVMAKRDVFVLMPTGGGKSLCYQLPAVISTGITFVVSPLISLIQDQILNLEAKNVTAMTVSSGVTEKQRREVFNDLNSPQPRCKLFYITPEMLMRSHAFQGILERLVSRDMVARFVIDEAHCLSQWGHDFRPDYKELKVLKSTYPQIPIMALTATANSRVKADIIQNLGIKDCVRLAQSFNRPNLRYYVLRKTKSVEVDIVSFINSHYHGKSGIIYCLSKKDCELMAHNLQVKYRINAKYYHANLNPKDRHQVQKDWAANRVQVIVATIAFGMGIDKPDVRFVIHHSIPKSLEGYYQETGRAGRDGLDSTCVLYYSYGDKSTHDFLIDRSEGSFQQKQQQRESLREVVQFCENKIDCRRQMVLQYFGETFDQTMCNKTCDNCENRADVSVVDRSDYAKAVIQLLDSFGPGERITLVQLIDVFRGSGAKKYEKYFRSASYGAGSSLSKGETERLLQNMVAQNVLAQFNVSNAMGYVSTYVRTGKDATDVLRGTKKVTLVVDNSLSPEIPIQAAVPMPQTTLPTRNKTLSKRKKIRDDPVDSDPEGDGYDGDGGFDDNSDTIEQPAVKGKKRATTPPPLAKKKNATAKTTAKTDSSAASAAALYNAVLQRREEICVREKLPATKVMNNKTIKDISMAMPVSLTELAKVKGIDDDKLLRYGADIIDIVKKFKS